MGMFTMKGDRDFQRGILPELSLTGQMKLICFYRFEIDFALSFRTVLSSFLQSAEQDFASEQKQISMIGMGTEDFFQCNLFDKKW